MMRRSIINNPEDASSNVVRGLGHHPFHQLVEGQDAIVILNLPNDCATKEIQSGLISQGSRSYVLFDLALLAWYSRPSGMETPENMQPAFLIG